MRKFSTVRKILGQVTHKYHIHICK